MAVNKLTPLVLLAVSAGWWLIKPVSRPVREVEASNDLVISALEVLETKSRFTHEDRETIKELDFKTVTNIDPLKDACGEEELAREGKAGERKIRTRITYFDGEKYSEEPLKTETIEPVDRLIVRGGKKIYKSLETSDGNIEYWCKMEKMLATSYDSTCKGCDMVTATGMKQGFGVVAVDPKVIPLHTKLFVPGYGVAVAGDTGGLIKGKRIDLGYDSLMGQWSRRYVDVYLL